MIAPSWLDDPVRRLRYRLGHLATVDDALIEGDLTILRDGWARYVVFHDGRRIFRAAGPAADQIQQVLDFVFAYHEENTMPAPALTFPQLRSLRALDAHGTPITDSRILAALLRRGLIESKNSRYVLTDAGRQAVAAHRNEAIETDSTNTSDDAQVISITHKQPAVVMTVSTEPAPVDAAHCCPDDCPARRVLADIAGRFPEVARLLELETERAALLDRIHRGEVLK